MARWSNWCHGLPAGTVLQFQIAQSNLATGEVLAISTPADGLLPPRCIDENQPAILDLEVEGAPAIPACDPLALNWTHTSVLDITRGLRFTWAVETGTKCLLDTTIQVSVTGADGTTVNTRKPAEELHLNVIVGVGSNPTVIGVLWNVCGPTQLAATLIMDSQSWSALDVPAPPCEDPSRPAEFSALWTGTVSSVFLAPVQVTPFAGSDAPTMTYTVKAGDTLASIAHAFEQPLARLIGLNPGLDPMALTVGQEIKIPAASTVTPASAEHLCSLAGCVIAADVAQDVDGWLALAAGRALRPNGPPELYLVDHGVRSTISPEDFRSLAKDNLGSAPRLVAIGDPQKNGVLDLVFEGSGGAIVSIAVEPGPAGTYPPTGMTLWEAVPGDGDNAETSFGTATYQRVP
ncbi:MAG: LysM peptidoglycan-binding domain-containing protein [Dehalococcoidia bacterium]